MNSWFRFYNEVLDDPKVQDLAPKLYKIWTNLMCLASRNDGVIPCLKDTSFSLRMRPSVMKACLEELTEKGLLDNTSKGLQPHNWDNRQFVSDNVTDRVKRFRERSKVVSETLHVTAPDSDQTQTTDTEGKGEGSRTRKTRAPAELPITDSMRAWATENGINSPLEFETEKMLDHFRGKGETRLDWIATWRTWMRNSKKFNGGNGNGRHYESKAQGIERRTKENAQRVLDALRAPVGNDNGTGTHDRTTVVIRGGTRQPQ